PFPDVSSGRWQVSSSGGQSPVWAHSGRELFYIDPAENFVAVPINAGSAFATGTAHTLFKTPAGGLTSPVDRVFDVSPDDRRFLFLRSVSSGIAAPPSGAIVIPNWLTKNLGRLNASN
ncbi:MAG: hypothetical protein ABR582_09765, partial [Gemmatimonadaceae bacterium]